MSATVISNRSVAILAAGTGGHIFPALSVAMHLRSTGWQIHWLGATGSMEERIAQENSIPFHAIDFSGVRGKGFFTLIKTPWRLLKAISQSVRVLRQIQSNVVIGFGGYITAPGALAARMLNISIVLHEQNTIMGSANRLAARMARHVLSTFPLKYPPSTPIGNPLRSEFEQQPNPQIRFATRSGPLKLLVLGGSLGAQALNSTVPQALALIPASERPLVLHQSGTKHIDALRTHYSNAGVEGELTPFISDVASALADADLVLCRAGASTISEIMAVGCAAIFVPFPYAIDDHQTVNARYLVDQDAAWLITQNDLQPELLANFFKTLQRSDLQDKAMRAHALHKSGAVMRIAQICEELVS